MSSLFLNWQAVAKKLLVLKKKLGEDEYSALREIRETVLQLEAPPQLVCHFIVRDNLYFITRFV